MKGLLERYDSSKPRIKGDESVESPHVVEVGLPAVPVCPKCLRLLLTRTDFQPRCLIVTIRACNDCHVVMTRAALFKTKKGRYALNRDLHLTGLLPINYTKDCNAYRA